MSGLRMLTKQCAQSKCGDCPIEDSFSLGRTDYPVAYFSCDCDCHEAAAPCIEGAEAIRRALNIGSTDPYEYLG